MKLLCSEAIYKKHRGIEKYFKLKIISSEVCKYNIKSGVIFWVFKIDNIDCGAFEVLHSLGYPSSKEINIRTKGWMGISSRSQTSFETIYLFPTTEKNLYYGVADKFVTKINF